MAMTTEPARIWDYIHEWFEQLPPVSWQEAVPRPGSAAVCCTDIIDGFCYQGRLASPRVAALVPRIADFFRQAYTYGIRNFVLTQDAHSPDAEEFNAFPPHCIHGSSESRTVPELASLPFADLFKVISKNSLSPALGTDFDQWLDARPEVETYLVVGDCTDFCVYFLAMHLRLRSNAYHRAYRVIVPCNLVDTYDLPVTAAKEIGVMAHDADFFHQVFLYHLSLCGVTVVKEILGD